MLHRSRWATIALPKGIGRIGTISEVAIVAICRAERLGLEEDRGLEVEWRGLQVGEKLVEVGFLPEMFDPSPSAAGFVPEQTIRVDRGSGSEFETLNYISGNGLPLRISEGRDWASTVAATPVFGGGVLWFDNIPAFDPIVIPPHLNRIVSKGSIASE